MWMSSGCERKIRFTFRWQTCPSRTFLEDLDAVSFTKREVKPHLLRVAPGAPGYRWAGVLETRDVNWWDPEIALNDLVQDSSWFLLKYVADVDKCWWCQKGVCSDKSFIHGYLFLDTTRVWDRALNDLFRAHFRPVVSALWHRHCAIKFKVTNKLISCSWGNTQMRAV